MNALMSLLGSLLTGVASRQPVAFLQSNQPHRL